MFEWGGGCLWCGNKNARDRFGVGPIEEKLLLTEPTRLELNSLSGWHDKSLNWQYPPDPGPWSSEEHARFEAATLSIQHRLQNELGPEFEVVYVPL